MDGVSGLLPVALAVAGAAALAFAALLLSFETRLSARTTREEMGFLVSLGGHFASLYDDAHPEDASTDQASRQEAGVLPSPSPGPERRP